MEPKGLYNYFSPVLSELFVGASATGNFIKGSCNDKFSDWKQPKMPSSIYKTAKFLGMNGLIEERLKATLFHFHKLYEVKGMDFDYLFSIFPYAYATGQVRKLLDHPDASVSDKAINYFRSYYGEE